MIRQDQITRRRRLVQVRREADFIADLGESLLERTGQRVRRIRAVHEDQRHLPRCHVGREAREIGKRIRCANRQIRAELDQRADRAGDVVQDVDGGHDLRAIGILGRHTAGDGEAALGIGELGGEADDDRRLDTDDLRHRTRRVPCKQSGESGRVRRHPGQPLADDHLRHRERQRPLGAGSRGDPFVRIHPGQREPRPHVDEFGHRRGTP